MTDDRDRIAELEQDVARLREELAEARRVTVTGVIKSVLIALAFVIFFVPVVTLIVAVGATGYVMDLFDRYGGGKAGMATGSARFERS